MHIHISGENIPDDLYSLISAITDHAKLNINEVEYDASNGVITLGIQRYPLLKKRNVLSNKHDFDNPLNSRIIINEIKSCDIQDNTNGEINNVELVFGVVIEENKIYLSSAEEDKGLSLFAIEMLVNGIDIQIIDRNN